MSNEFVMVPRCLLSEVISNLGEWSEGLDTQDQVDFIGEQLDRLTSVMSASAEPSEPKCKSRGQVPEGQGGEYPCKACGLPTVHDEPSAPVEELYPKCTVLKDENVRYSNSTAPVEIDERAEFEADFKTRYPQVFHDIELGKCRDGQYLLNPAMGEWSGWQARAALERKPL